jgi:hypothetical protein
VLPAASLAQHNAELSISPIAGNVTIKFGVLIPPVGSELNINPRRVVGRVVGRVPAWVGGRRSLCRGGACFTANGGGQLIEPGFVVGHGPISRTQRPVLPRAAKRTDCVRYGGHPNI